MTTGTRRKFRLDQVPGGYTARQLAELVGVHIKTVHRWAKAGLDEDTADRLAVAVGLHPAHIWPEWFD